MILIIFIKNIIYLKFKEEKEIFKFDWEKSGGVHFSNLIVNQILKS